MIQTRIINIDKKDIDIEQLMYGAEILKNGGTVIFPTETVYGLGANALDEKAVKKIFEAKGRPSDNPLIIHIAKAEDINDLITDLPQKSKELIDKFWPGPLTLIFKKSSIVPKIVTGGLDTVAIRIPAHPIARLLIELAEVPVAAPSANLSGKPSPTKGQHVIDDLKGRVDAIICGGDTTVGVESTVLDITSDIPMILRPGGVTKEELEKVVGRVDVDPALQKSEGIEIVPKSPGMKYTHYSPNADVILISGKLNDVINNIKKIRANKENEGYKVGIMATDETKDKYEGGTIISVGSRSKLESVAANLFKTLREFDKKNVDIILSETFEEKGLGQAIMNRLIKAAGYNVLRV
ncbi:L-threonylcarbamoyladenylate synthase [Paramaledivibacter caminithermalis]|jgi:L-threonylcarbamoyladenylate synthase|uniref:Threonylcarbamoyl-AMP synthase n=1 Tax=Paramaledivibacter caminithermalis (strain DSM 15212 / CIP 107654 / DViRD3) TaxID=1121301 RepID=A0A1M6L2B4_PARC5|nr:L-threonylcarbamoyladenylate synthase [Paramaledivibacter caminithermalis]SHJ65358.1 translation factor SUA5 [Paramaledivibacter caminithermalis DSM 15212]